jgi:hypothetical protein
MDMPPRSAGLTRCSDELELLLGTDELAGGVVRVEGALGDPGLELWAIAEAAMPSANAPARPATATLESRRFLITSLLTVHD